MIKNVAFTSAHLLVLTDSCLYKIDKNGVVTKDKRGKELISS